MCLYLIKNEKNVRFLICRRLGPFGSSALDEYIRPPMDRGWPIEKDCLRNVKENEDFDRESAAERKPARLIGRPGPDEGAYRHYTAHLFYENSTMNTFGQGY